MLSSLEIRNIALIDGLRLELGPNMNVLTGETGAGKSIIVDSIGALLGARVSRESVRTGTSAGSVKGTFTRLSLATYEFLRNELPGICPEKYSPDFELTVERDISAEGRHGQKVCGRTVSSGLLRRLGDTLIDVHGQSDSRLLTDNQVQRELLDSWTGGEFPGLLREYREKLSRYRDLRRQLEALSGDPAARARLADLYSYQIKEIDGARLEPDEEEYLQGRRNVLAHAEKIQEGLENALAAAEGSDVEGEGGILGGLDGLRAVMYKLSDYGDRFKGLSERLEGIYYDFEETTREIGKLASESLYDPQEADLVNRRLDYLFKLKSKYGGSYSEIMKFRDEAAEKLKFLTGSEADARELEAQIRDLSGELFDLAFRLDGLRRASGKLLEDRIMAELNDLEMTGTEFRADIDFGYETDEMGLPVFGRAGLSRVEFLISPNPGEPLKPLARIASGGELSRIMLSIKTVQNLADNISTMIFDEIDTGISGVAANRIAAKLKELSAAHQIICVTHHAQLAAISERHIYISKTTSGGSTSTRAQVLEGEERVTEIARLLDGNTGSRITRMHAEEMLKG